MNKKCCTLIDLYKLLKIYDPTNVDLFIIWFMQFTADSQRDFLKLIYRTTIKIIPPPSKPHKNGDCTCANFVDSAATLKLIGKCVYDDTDSSLYPTLPIIEDCMFVNRGYSFDDSSKFKLTEFENTIATTTQRQISIIDSITQPANALNIFDVALSNLLIDNTVQGSDLNVFEVMSLIYIRQIIKPAHLIRVIPGRHNNLRLNTSTFLSTFYNPAESTIDESQSYILKRPIPIKSVKDIILKLTGCGISRVLIQPHLSGGVRVIARNDDKNVLRLYNHAGYQIFKFTENPFIKSSRPSLNKTFAIEFILLASKNENSRVDSTVLDCMRGDGFTHKYNVRDFEKSLRNNYIHFCIIDLLMFNGVIYTNHKYKDRLKSCCDFAELYNNISVIPCIETSVINTTPRDLQGKFFKYFDLYTKEIELRALPKHIHHNGVVFKDPDTTLKNNEFQLVYYYNIECFDLYNKYGIIRTNAPLQYIESHNVYTVVNTNKQSKYSANFIATRRSGWLYLIKHDESTFYECAGIRLRKDPCVKKTFKIGILERVESKTRKKKVKSKTDALKKKGGSKIEELNTINDKVTVNIRDCFIISVYYNKKLKSGMPTDIDTIHIPWGKRIINVLSSQHD